MPRRARLGTSFAQGKPEHRLVNFQGQVVYDSLVARRKKEAYKQSREGEPFTATTDCPECSTMAVHWIDDKLIPLVDGQQFMRRGITVDRVCIKCDYRWGQA